MTSIVIPAYNEEAVIVRTLQSVLASVGDRAVEIVVVCNACRDRTAELARAVDSRVQVIETATPGKCAAINLGEQHVRSFPRIYLDADIQVSSTLIGDLESALEQDAAAAAWPDVQYDLSQSSWAVSAFYRVWTSLPYNAPGRIGVGAYALSELGRQRFDRFPEIISDDGYVRGLYELSERRIVESCHTVVQPPRDLRSLVAVRTRSRMGVYELGRKHPQVLAGHRARGLSRMSGWSKLLVPSLWPSLPIYAAIVLWTKWKARARLRAEGGKDVWDRDLSTRLVP